MSCVGRKFQTCFKTYLCNTDWYYQDHQICCFIGAFAMKRCKNITTKQIYIFAFQYSKLVFLWGNQFTSQSFIIHLSQRNNACKNAINSSILWKQIHKTLKASFKHHLTMLKKSSIVNFGNIIQFTPLIMQYCRSCCSKDNVDSIKYQNFLHAKNNNDINNNNSNNHINHNEITTTSLTTTTTTTSLTTSITTTITTT